METLLTPRRAALALLAGALLWLLRCARNSLRWRARTRGRPLPPSPKPLPFIGNILDVPSITPWITYRDMCSQLGDIIHLDALGQSLVIVGTTRIASDLFEKRSANYSDRPKPMMPTLVGVDWLIGFLPYGQWWRRHRRAFWQHFHPGVVDKHRMVQQHEVRRLLGKLLDDPVHLGEHVRYVFGASVLKVIYNIEVEDEHDPIIDALETSMEGITEALLVGSSMLEFMPWLRHLPSWLPFQKRISKVREASRLVKHLPYERATTVESQSGGTGRRSVVDALRLRLSPLDDESEEIIMNVAGVAYAGGADTTIAAIQGFFLAMSLNPDAQKKAQAELDLVIGPDRLADLSDRDSLPYVNALIKEVSRWHVVAPLSIPHVSIEDDEYEGYFIPAGSIVLPNVWAMLHDPEVYPDPHAFKPERFTDDNVLGMPQPDPTIGFGFGRRICPGRYFADTSLFITVASVLHTFDITPPLDENGEPINVSLDVTSSFISYPKDIRCTIKPRSARSIELVRNATMSKTAAVS